MREHWVEKTGKEDTQGGQTLWKGVIGLRLWCGEGGEKECLGTKNQ